MAANLEAKDVTAFVRAFNQAIEGEGEDLFALTTAHQKQPQFVGIRNARIEAVERGAVVTIKAEYDTERTIAFTGKDGTPIDGGIIRLPIPIHRGTYDSGRTDEAGDEVMSNGSCWRAKGVCRNVEPGDDSADSKRLWLLTSMRGKQGKGAPGR